MADFPAQQPAYMGEWVFNGSTSAPPANTQLRLNNSSEKNATAIYISNLTVNGINATDFLMSLITGCSIRLENKNDPTKWHVYAITSDPISQSGYVELKAVWQSGSTALLATNLMLTTVNMVTKVGGIAATTAIGTTSTKIGVSIPVYVPPMTATCGHVAVLGKTVSREFAYPFQGEHMISPGMTLRQYYAAQAINEPSSPPPLSGRSGRHRHRCRAGSPRQR
jgi:hypothetical protein